MKIKAMTDKQLIEEYKSLYESIYVIDCFGTKDLLLLQAIETELYNRKYEISEVKSVFVKKAPK
jgi:hypothetical protein